MGFQTSPTTTMTFSRHGAFKNTIKPHPIGEPLSPAVLFRTSLFVEPFRRGEGALKHLRLLKIISKSMIVKKPTKLYYKLYLFIAVHILLHIPAYTCNILIFIYYIYYIYICSLQTFSFHKSVNMTDFLF